MNILGLLSCFFFFQAEDGIRDLVRSRGLGDVYKRQALYGESARDVSPKQASYRYVQIDGDVVVRHGHIPVSYTHLTLPTSDLV